MTLLRRDYDIAVVGAGPTGCVTAVAFARKGARVLLLEANPKACSRFAGEWIHPPGAKVLESLDISLREETAEHPPCEGFVVFPDDGTEPIRLPYADGAFGLSCEHERLVMGLRRRAEACAGVDYIPHARVSSIDSEGLTFCRRETGTNETILAERVVGADGRSSIVRQYLDMPENSTLLSYMAGIDLYDVELPFEGYGHVILGAPGPVLLYRTGARSVKACIDLPLNFQALRKSPSRLWDAFGPLFPAGLRPAFRRALEEKQFSWAACRFRPRSRYGYGRHALVGDAVGHSHPLTATGMTIGFLDCQALANSKNLEAYQAVREQQTYVSELLASALYQVLTREDPGALAIRQAVYATWRASSSERRRTMQILAGSETRSTAFGSAFLHVAGTAVQQVLGEVVRTQRWSDFVSTGLSFAGWSRWPIASITPRRARIAWRPRSASTDPLQGAFAGLREQSARAREALNKRGLLKSATPAAAAACEGAAPEAEGVSKGRPSSSASEWIERISTFAEEIWDQQREVGALEKEGASLLRQAALSLFAESTIALDARGSDVLSEGHVLKAFEIVSHLPKSDGTLLTQSICAHLALLLEDSGVNEMRPHLEALVSCLLGRQLQAPIDGGPHHSPGEFEEGSAAIARLLQRMSARYAGLLAAQKRTWTDKVRSLLEQDVARDGSWSRHSYSSVFRTACALETLLALGVPRTDPRIRRGVAWLVGQQNAQGLWLDDEIASRPDWLVSEDAKGELCANLYVSARVLSVLRSANAPYPESIDRGYDALFGQLAGGALLEGGASTREAEERSWVRLAALAEVTRALSLQEKAERSRPRNQPLARPSRKGKEEGAAARGPTLVVAASRGEPASPRPLSHERLVNTNSANFEQCGEFSERDWEFCKESLLNVSRTFARPIELLDQPLRVAVTCGYLLCRIADTVEDMPSLRLEQREDLYNRFLRVLSGHEEPASFAAAFSKVATGDHPDLRLSRNLPAVMRVFRSLSVDKQQACSRWITEMAVGMHLYSRRTPDAKGLNALYNEQDLQRYCYFVAGTVGHMLTELFLSELKDVSPECAPMPSPSDWGCSWSTSSRT